MHYHRFSPEQLDEIFKGGGARYDPKIINFLKENRPNTRSTTIDEIGILVGLDDALHFAFKACEYL